MNSLSLLITLFLPLAGAIIILLINKENKVLIRNFALGISILTFIVSLLIFFAFDSKNPGFQLITNIPWVKSLDSGFRIGVDGMSVLLVMLTTFLSPIALLGSFDSIKSRDKEYYTMYLLLQFGMTGVFVSLDIFLFYIFWEIILIPMYFMIGIWGGKNRIYAAVKFFLFTIVGSLLMLVAIVWLGYYVGGEVLRSNPEILLNNPEILKFYPNLINKSAEYQLAALPSFTTNFLLIKQAAGLIPFEIQKWMFLAFALSFCIKVPLFPLHTWLPDAHTEAPTPGSVILAGVLLKMGTYGLIRFNLELFPLASFSYSSMISWLAVIGIVYGALVAMVQTDVKRLVAFSSVSHLGFVVLGIFSMTTEGIQGAIIQMVNHGLSTGMLFLCVGIIYERRHTRDIVEFGGLARVMPTYTVFFAIAMLASVGLPGLNGFVGEFLTLLGAFKSPFLNSYLYAIISATGVIFAACYLLLMFQKVMFGPITNPLNQNLNDLSKREWATLAPIVFFIVWIGVHPGTFLNVSENSTKHLVEKLEIMKFGKPGNQIPSISKSGVGEQKKETINSQINLSK
jgi:NADH-quinone oxidoreductase subunit M